MMTAFDMVALIESDEYGIDAIGRIKNHEHETDGKQGGSFMTNQILQRVVKKLKSISRKKITKTIEKRLLKMIYWDIWNQTQQ